VSHEAKDIMNMIYGPIMRSYRGVFFTDPKSAEIIKYASNAFLATKISFINEIANFSEKVGANILDIARGMGADKRIGPRFLHAGIGYGGSCFPKDVKALMATGRENDYDFQIIKAVDEINDKQKLKLIEKLDKYIHPQTPLTI
jgi:UDPglucose 6-dehydrogenase